MKRSKNRQLDATVARIQRKYGVQALQRGSDRPRVQLPDAISSGFATLDGITGCRGIPLGAITVLSGRSTSGKTTLAYKVLASSQEQGHLVAIVDPTGSVDGDYLSRCRVDLDSLLVARAENPLQAVEALVALVRSRQVRLVVLDSLADIRAERKAMRLLRAQIDYIQKSVRDLGCGLLLLDESHPPWLRAVRTLLGNSVLEGAGLHIELQRERWLEENEKLIGYQARASVRRSRWAQRSRTAMVEIVFNGTIRARETW